MATVLSADKHFKSKLNKPNKRQIKNKYNANLDSQSASITNRVTVFTKITNISLSIIVCTIKYFAA